MFARKGNYKGLITLECHFLHLLQYHYVYQAHGAVYSTIKLAFVMKRLYI